MTLSPVFNTRRFRQEIAPAVVIENWVKQCEPGLLPGVKQDYWRIRAHLFAGKENAAPSEQKLYIATAGGPSSGKSTALDFELAEGSDPRYKNTILIDPDRYTMNYMFAYQDMMTAGAKAGLGIEEAAKQAYNRARPGSNIIALLNYNEAFSNGFHIAHGTTMTSPQAGEMLAKLGAAGYERRLLLCATPDDVRIAAGEQRVSKEAHYQVTPEDFVQKGLAFPQRMADYFAHGDHLLLLWKDDVQKRAVCAAEYRDGHLFLRDGAAFVAYVKEYETKRETLAQNGVSLPSWEDMEAVYAARFAAPVSTPRAPGL